MPFKSLFRTCLGTRKAPMKNPINAMSIVMTRLVDGAVTDKSKNNAKSTSTINGLKMWFFSIGLLFRKLRKFSSG